MSFLSKIGHFITGIFNGAKALYEDLVPIQQDATKTASGIIAIINANLSADPQAVMALIKIAYPDITEQQVSDVLANVSNTIGAITDATQHPIQALQTYLSKFTGNKWVVISKSLVALIADELAPGSVIQKIELVIEWVYQTFIKGKVTVVPAVSGDTDGDNDSDDGHPENGADGVGNHPNDPPPHP